MNMEHPSILELEELMLSAPCDRGDSRTAKRPELLRGYAALEGGVNERDTVDDSTHRGFPQRSGSAFDFRQLGHVAES